MAETLAPDICVIGGGPGGIAAARAAAAAGAAVVLVEKKTLGGANVTSGAVPLTALMAAAALHEAGRRGPALGVTAGPLQVNWGKLRDHVAAAGAAVAAGVSAGHLAAKGIRVVMARARFVDGDTVAAGEATIRARRFILAVGGTHAVPTLPGLANVEAMSPADVFEFARRPTHLLVLGATHEGVGLAQAHQRLGMDCTVLDEGPFLAGEDSELAAVLATALRRDGVRVRTGVKVEKITRRRGGVRVALRDPVEGNAVIDASHVLLASGRRPAADGLGLDAAGIAHDATGIAVKAFRTANRRVYAIGDAVPGFAGVARAEREALAVVRAILYRTRVRLASAPVPRATLTDPALVSVGLGEAEAREAKRDIRIWRYPFAETVQATADRVPDGIVKVVTAPGGRVLGAAVLGRDAAEHAALWSLAIARRLPLSAMADLAAAYPSRADAARALALAADGARLTAPWRKRIIRFFGKLG